MAKSKTFNYRNKVLDYGFIELEKQNSNVSIEDISNSTKESLFIVDTDGSLLLNALKRIESYLNQSEKILVGLTNDKTLSELKKSGVNNGLFRSTDAKFNVAIIIQDKSQVFLAFDVDRIFDVPSRYAKEIFEYVNHIFWSNTNFEQLQGSLKKVDNARLSVVVPSFLNDVSHESATYEYATENNSVFTNCVVLKTEKEAGKKAIVIPYDFNALSTKNDSLQINVFKDQFYSISNIRSLMIAESFENEKVGNLLNKKVWYKGNIIDVSENESIEDTVETPLDEVDSFVPDFEKYESQFKGLTLELTVNVQVNPIQIDGSYSLSKRYVTIQRVENLLDDSFEKLEKLELDKKIIKQIESIKSERLLINKVKMFNTFVGSGEFGVDALNNKKSPVSTINVNEDELIVPNELIGKLYVKQGKDYLATTKDRLNDAKNWLKENKMEAVLVKA